MSQRRAVWVAGILVGFAMIAEGKGSCVHVPGLGLPVIAKGGWRVAVRRDGQLKAVSSHGGTKTSPWQKEVFYQIFPNSFRDSNGDRVGDFEGIESKLGFLKNLGITTILLNPIFKSRFYHRYFADDFMTVDPHFGTNDGFFHLVRKAHADGMKVILDMEVQYVADRHPWYLAGGKGSAAAYLWDSPSVYTQKPLEGYDGQKIRVAAIDPANPAVLAAIKKVFDYWAAPSGKVGDGVDGFRIDHMMDDFDFLHKRTDMLTSFWRPIIESVHALKKNAFFVGEQADWGYGSDLFAKAGVDAVFAIPLRFAITTPGYPHHKEIVAKTADNAPAGKTQLIFIENHDVERIASVVNSDSRALRLGAVLNLTFEGTPILYQGQELGMKGIPSHGRTDANDIPQRLAYRWNKRLNAPGTATWYVGHVSKAAMSFSRSGDGISVEEESPDRGSLLNFYRKLIRLRQSHPVLQTGDQMELETDKPTLIAFERRLKGQQPILVVLNFSASAAPFSPPKAERWRTLLRSGPSLGPFGFWVAEAER